MATHDGAPPATPEVIAERRKTRLQERQTLTSRISETCRYICFGLLAIFYSVHTTKDDYGQRFVGESRNLLTLMALAATLSLVFDYLQYFFGRRSTIKALESDDQLFDKRWTSYRLREFFYNAKQVLMVAGVAILLFVMARYLGSAA